MLRASRLAPSALIRQIYLESLACQRRAELWISEAKGTCRYLSRCSRTIQKDTCGDCIIDDQPGLFEAAPSSLFGLGASATALFFSEGLAAEMAGAHSSR